MAITNQERIGKATDLLRAGRWGSSAGSLPSACDADGARSLSRHLPLKLASSLLSASAS